MRAMTSSNTVFPRRIASDPWSARGISEKRNQADNPARLSGGATRRLRRLKPLGFGNTTTLSEITLEHIKTK